MSKESKKSANDFGMASSIAAKIRKALSSYFLPTFDTMLYNRLTSSNIALLNGIELNADVRFDQLLKAACITYIADNTITIAVPPIEPTHIRMPKRAAHAILSITRASTGLEGQEDESFCIDEVMIEKDRIFEGSELGFYLPEKGRRLVVIAVHLL